MMPVMNLKLSYKLTGNSRNDILIGHTGYTKYMSDSLGGHLSTPLSHYACTITSGSIEKKN